MTERTDWPRILLVFVCGLAGAWQLGKIPPLLPQAAEALSLSGWQQGLIASAVTFLAIGLCGVAARLTARLRPVTGFALALGAILAGAIASTLAPSALVLIAARLSEGLGYVYLIVACPTLMAALARGTRDQGIALSIWGCFVPLGMALGGAAASLGAGLGGWRMGLATATLAPAVMLIAALVLLRGMAPVRDEAADPASQAPVSPGRAGALLAIGFGWFAFNFLALMAFFPTRWQDLGPVAPGTLSVVFAAVSAASIPGSLFVAARLGRGGNAVRLALIGAVLQGGFGILALTLPWQGVSMVAATLSIGLGGFTPAAAFALGPGLAGGGLALARLNGWLAAMGSTGSFLSPPAMGLAVDFAGWTGGAGLIAGGTVAGVLCFIGVARSARSRALDAPGSR